MNQSSKTRSICFAAVLAALVFVMTYVPRIPISLGYAHLGDAVIFLSYAYFNRRDAAWAASIGSCLSDFLGGFPIWIIPTFLIKYVMVVIVFAVAQKDGEKTPVVSLRTVLAFLLSAAWMVVSYTVSGGILYGSFGAAAAMVPGLIMEGLFNGIIAILAGMALSRVRLS